MAKSIKTNSIQELMKAKGISSQKKKASESKVVPRETSRKRLYDLASLADDMPQDVSQVIPQELTQDMSQVVTQEHPQVVSQAGAPETSGIVSQVVIQDLPQVMSQVMPQEHTQDMTHNVSQFIPQDVTQVVSQISKPKSAKKIVSQDVTQIVSQERTQVMSQDMLQVRAQVRTQDVSQVRTQRFETLLETQPETHETYLETQLEIDLKDVFQIPTKLPSASELKVLFFLQQIYLSNGRIVAQKKQLAEALNLRFATVRTSITRLKQKGFINLTEYASGGGVGYSAFEITKEGARILKSPSAINRLGTNPAKDMSQRYDSSYVSNPPLSSSSINTTTTEKEILIPHTLQEMGVKQKSFDDALAAGLSVNEIQDSLEAFAHDFSHGLVKSENPQRMLFGILRKGRPYLSATYTEKINREINEAVKRADEAFKKRHDLEEAKFKAAFNEWRIENPELVEQLLFSADYMVQKSTMLAEAYLIGEYRKLIAQDS